MIEVGHFALILAALAALTQTGFASGAAWHEKIAIRGDWLLAARRAGLVQTGLLIFAFACLVYAFLRSDFSLALAAAHSHSAKPVFYKFAAVWGNHEGSLLLWSLFLALATCLPAAARTMPPALLSRFLAVQGVIASAFLFFILIASNPFARLSPAPFQGQGLNPVLQDIALIMHPPILYAGYVGLSIAFSFAAAALLHPPSAKAFVHFARPWILLAWSCLGTGIILGAWWAYRELGWGGYWFWDPVENAALMPWLAATALLHTAAMSEKRQHFLLMTIFLSLIGFTLALLGTFLTRSGVLVSVHSFAADPLRGAAILMIMSVLSGGAFLLFALRAPLLARIYAFAPASREGAIFIQSLLLLAATATVLTGTLYPLFVEYVSGERITVGPPYFNAAFLPLMAPLLLLLPVASFLPRQQTRIKTALAPLIVPACASLILCAAILIVLWPNWKAALGMAAGLWIIFGAAMRFYRARPQRKSEYGMNLAHAGAGILVFGIAALAAGQLHQSAALKAGETTRFAGFELTLETVAPRQGRDFRAEAGRLIVRQNGAAVALLEPEIRRYAARPSPVREIAITRFWLPPADLYVVMGEEEQGKRVFSLHYNPFVMLIWLGGMLAALGGLWALISTKHKPMAALLVGFLILLPTTGFAKSPPELTAAQETRAMEVIARLQCITCEGQPLASSPAPFAAALRQQIRRRIAQGESKEEILNALTKLYGKKILLTPPFEPITWPLWAAPGIFAVTALTGAFIFIRRRKTAPTASQK